MPEPKGQLMDVPRDGATHKPESLIGVRFTVMDVEYVDTSDGRKDVQKFLARHVDQSLGMYWTPGTWCRRQLERWFHQNPHTELFATLTREKQDNGYFQWKFVQLTADAAEDMVMSAPADATDEIPF